MFGVETMILSKGSPIKMFLKHAIKTFKERGQLDLIKRKWELANQNCDKTSRSPLGIKKLSTLFIIVLSGFSLAFITFLLEIWYEKYDIHQVKITNQSKSTKDMDDEISVDELKMMIQSIINTHNLVISKDENQKRILKLKQILESAAIVYNDILVKKEQESSSYTSDK